MAILLRELPYSFSMELSPFLLPQFFLLLFSVLALSLSLVPSFFFAEPLKEQAIAEDNPCDSHSGSWSVPHETDQT